MLGFVHKYPVECGVYGVRRHFHANYGIGNGKPTALFQRVLATSEQNVNHCVLMFGSVTSAAILEVEHCAALVQKSGIVGAAAEEGVEMLRRVCTVIDVESPDADERLAAVVPNGKVPHDL